jgi:hypothetical protein
LFQTKNLPNPQKKKDYFYKISHNKKIHEKGTFEYQIQSQKAKTKDIYSFENALNLTNFYIQELGLKIGSSADDKMALNKYWSYVDQDQKFLSRYNMEKDIVRINQKEGHSECHILQNQFLFRKKKNLMELSALKSRSK